MMSVPSILLQLWLQELASGFAIRSLLAFSILAFDMLKS